MKYPENWEEIDNTPAIISFASKNRDDNKNVVQIRNDERKNNISFVEQIKRKGNFEPEIVKINNNDFYYLKTSIAGIVFYEYYIENKDKIFIVSMINMSVDLPENIQDESDIKYPTNEKLSEELKILKIILSTFKFIE